MEMEKINTEALPEKTQTKFKEFLSFQFLFKKIDKFAKNKQQQENNLLYLHKEIAQKHEEDIQSNKNIILKAELDKEIRKIIEDGDQSKLIVYLEKGYHFPHQNFQTFLNIIKQPDTFHSPIIKQFLIDNHMDDMHEYFHSQFNRMQENKDESNHTFIILNLPDIVEQFKKTLSYIKTNNFFNDPKTSLKLLDDLKMVKRTINRPKCFSATGESSLKNIDPIISYIEITHKEAIEQKFHDTVDYFNNVLQGFNGLKETISVDVLSNIRKFNEKDLPEPSREVIQEIKKIYNEISTDKLNVQQTLELDNLYKKRFPQLLEEYITISPRYREKLQLHDENPDRLLLESLSDIKNKINNVFEQVQENNVNKLKVTTKYLKNV